MTPTATTVNPTATEVAADTSAETSTADETPARRRWPRRLAIGAAGLTALAVLGSSLSGSADNALSGSESAAVSSDGLFANGLFSGGDNMAAEMDAADGDFAEESLARGAAPAFAPDANITVPSEPEAPVGSVLDSRDIIRTADVDIRVDDIAEAEAKVRAAAARAGGIVSDARIELGPNGYAVITLRVPSESLDSVINGVGSIGTVTGVRQGSDDVTGQLTDIDSQLRNLRAVESELLVLMEEARERAGTTSEVMNVFNQIRNVRNEIEMIEGRKASIADRVALSTLTVNLFVEDGASPVDVVDPDDTPAAEDAVEALKAVSAAALGGLIWLGIFIIPVALMFGLPLAIVGWFVRRRTRKEAVDS